MSERTGILSVNDQNFQIENSFNCQPGCFQTPGLNQDMGIKCFTSRGRDISIICPNSLHVTRSIPVDGRFLPYNQNLAKYTTQLPTKSLPFSSIFNICGSGREKDLTQSGFLQSRSELIGWQVHRCVNSTVKYLL